MDHLSTDIQRIPAPLLQPEYQPVEIEQLNECHFAFFDVETTGTWYELFNFDGNLINIHAFGYPGMIFQLT